MKRAKLTLSAALILTATTASAGYYNTTPDGRGGYTYTQPTESEILQRQLYMQQQEINEMRARQGRCFNRIVGDGVATYCPD